MNGLPLHPAIVHVPLGLSVVLPLVAIGLAWALWRGRIGRGVWAGLVGLQAVIVVAGLVALHTGHEAAHRVHGVVPRAAIHAHAERAEAFEWLAGATLVLATGVLVVPGRARRVLGAVTAAATLVVAGAGVLVGEAGGRLVYAYDAPKAYLAPGARPAPAPATGDDDDAAVRPPPAPRGAPAHPKALATHGAGR